MSGLLVVSFVVAALGSAVLPVLVSSWWWLLTGTLLFLAVVAIHDVFQRRHSVLRNYPVLGHLRYLLEGIRPEFQQYFIERNTDGAPFDRDVRSIVYQRAKGTKDLDPFGTELNVYAGGHESLVHSIAPVRAPQTPPRARVGGPHCTRPYDMALLNVSAMSFGSLSANAILALNTGAARGGFAHDTGEGGISEYHLRPGGDLVWEIGTGYFGCRTREGLFDEHAFADGAAHEAVKCVELKLSQGAKPGHGGVLPGSKVNAEVARARGVPEGQTVISPPYHRMFSTPRGLVQFLARMRELAGGKPVGIKLCVGSRREVLAVCKAMLVEGTAPDFIVVDGAEGGTGAAPLEFVDNVGMPLTEGLMIVQNALVGTGLREHVALGASGKVATGSDIVKRLIQGADYTNAARPMMFALGCIQAQRCHTNTCPVGVATQDPFRARALVVADKAQRVERFQRATVRSSLELMAAMGVDDPAQLGPRMLQRRVDGGAVLAYSELYRWLGLRELCAEPPQEWAQDWRSADPDRFVS